MKVLVVWYDYFQYLSGVVDGLNSLPNIYAEKFILKEFNKCHNIFIKLLSKSGFQYFKEQYFRRVRKDIMNRIEKYDPDAVLFINADYREIVNKELLSFIKNKGKKTIIWFFDSLGRMKENLYDSNYLNSFDLLYSFDYTDIEYIENKFSVIGAKHLPFGVDKFTYCNNNTNCNEKIYDICFVGNADEKRLSILEKVAKYCVDNNKRMVVYGQIWKFSPVIQRLKHKYIIKRKYPNLYNFVVNMHLPPRKVAEIYSQSKICLNIIRDKSGSNSRIFEILSTNTLQVIEYCNFKDLELINGQELVMYKDDEELISILNYYLSNELERKKIAYCGYIKTINKYTTDILLKNMVADIKEIL